MITKKLKSKLLFEVKHTGYPKCGGFAAIGNTLYCLKTNSPETKTALLKYTKSGKVWKKQCIAIEDMGHGNGMTTDGKNLYIAAGGGKTDDARVLRISPKGTGLLTYRGKDFPGFLSIAYGRKNHYLIKNGGNNTYIRYRHIALNGPKGIYYEKPGCEQFYVYNPLVKDGYIVRQDIAYREINGKKLLYVILCKISTQKGILTIIDNAILIYNLAADFTVYQGQKIFKPIYILLDQKKDFYKFEFESIDFYDDNELSFYCFANICTKNSADEHDAVYKFYV